MTSKWSRRAKNVSALWRHRARLIWNVRRHHGSNDYGQVSRLKGNTSNG